VVVVVAVKMSAELVTHQSFSITTGDIVKKNSVSVDNDAAADNDNDNAADADAAVDEEDDADDDDNAACCLMMMVTCSSSVKRSGAVSEAKKVSRSTRRSLITW